MTEVIAPSRNMVTKDYRGIVLKWFDIKDAVECVVNMLGSVLDSATA